MTKWRAARLILWRDDAIRYLKQLDDKTIAELIRRGQESSEIDGYGSGTTDGGGRTSAGDHSDPTLSAVVSRENDSRSDPLLDAINRIFEIVESTSKDLREADRKRQVVIFAADGRRGRESSLQGNCSVCNDPVTGVADDRLRRGLDSKCWVSWSAWKLKNPTCGDPGEDFQRFRAWRIERLSAENSELTA